MIPMRGFTIRAKAPVVIRGIDSAATWTRNLLSKHGGRLCVLKRLDQRAKPMGALRGRVCVEEDSKIRTRLFHPPIHDPTRVILLRPDLAKGPRGGAADQIERTICGSGIDDDQFPVAVILG